MTLALPVDASLLAEVFDKVPSAIIVLDDHGYVKRANQSASKLLGVEHLENERWVELVSKVFRPRQDDGHEISTIDGRRLQVITLELQSGQLIQMTDLTQTRALQDKISHMERLSSLGKMAASLAHQIRTPLSAAMLYAANLGNANLQPMARKRFQEKLMGRLEALEAQVSDILMFARSNEQTVTEIDASQLVDQTASNVSAVLAKGDAELETISDAGSMPILGNATALTGALSNLVANAVEAGANKIILKLTKDEEQNTITFSVANNGPTIPEELRQKIFEPFFTSKSSGTGLGLAVVTAVTKVHQGTLRLESWNEEYSTVFSITIPLSVGNHDGSSLANTVSSLRNTLESEDADETLSAVTESISDNLINASSHGVSNNFAASSNLQADSSSLGVGNNTGAFGANASHSTSMRSNDEFIGFNHAAVNTLGMHTLESMSDDLDESDEVDDLSSKLGNRELVDSYQEDYEDNSPLGSMSPNQITPVHKRGQIGAANAVLVAAVQKPKLS